MSPNTTLAVKKKKKTKKTPLGLLGTDYTVLYVIWLPFYWPFVRKRVNKEWGGGRPSIPFSPFFKKMIKFNPLPSF